LGEECIHGLDNGLCDACFPKARPEVAATAVVTKPRVTRPRPAPLTAPRRPVSSAAAASADDIGQQRIYHLTHVDNLASILEHGIRADAADASPSVDISSEDNRNSRRTIVVNDDGATVASYVPFFISPTSSVWESVRTRAADPRLTLDDHSVPADYVLLVSSVKTVVDANEAEEEAPVVVTDGDAAHALTRFATTRDAGERVLRKLRADDESGRILAAELLVKDAVPVELISLIAVANDRARNTVKDIQKSVGNTTRVAIHPPWFQIGE
jgi:hypothetical protein